MIGLPVFVCFSERSIAPFFYLFFFWVAGGILFFDVFQKRKNYFRVGKFYYSLQKLLEFYTLTNESVSEECFYCKGLKANSIPYRITLVKLKSIQLQNEGPMQHYARYNRKEYTISTPRSQKAFIVHSFASVIKVFTILFALIFLPFHSFIWRFIGGMGLSWLLASLILWFTATHSKTSYLFSYGMIIKIFIWLGVFILISKFDFTKCDIIISKYVNLIVMIMVFADSFIEQALNSPKKIHLFKPLLKKDQNIAEYFEKNCRLYLEIPFWTTVNPIIRWIF